MTDQLISGFPVRLLAIDDLPACLALAQDREWSPEEHKWRLLFEVGDVYGLDDPEGGLAATVVATRFGQEITAIGMMLVAKRCERRGLGSALLRYALDRSGTASAWLTATAYGRPMYERLGFRAIGECATYVGEPTGLSRDGSRPAEPTGLSRDGSRPAEPTSLAQDASRPAESTGRSRGMSRPAEPTDLPAILALDAEVFGAPRDALLTRLQTFSERFRVVDGPDGGLAGFAGAWRNLYETVLGPVVAQDAATARGLLADLAREAEGPVRVDIDTIQPELIAWAKEHGLSCTFSTTIMEYGAPLPTDRSRLFGPVMLALG
ncbi:GNAT family N-acetyltransferase [Microtetraspora fusca]|uniref:GNAT family N-acetyltransferase n=1 Tax=Microtetraspora fusca TaxID=1997 RepID=A0ABW6UXX6_MICFU